VEQPVERAATLEDVRAEVLTPDRLNAMVFGGFAVVALTIAVVGVAGVLAFSVSARTREFGIRLAIGSQPRHLLGRVIAEGTVITAVGIGAGFACGLALQRLAGRFTSRPKRQSTSSLSCRGRDRRRPWRARISHECSSALTWRGHSCLPRPHSWGRSWFDTVSHPLRVSRRVSTRPRVSAPQWRRSVRNAG